MLAIMWGLVLAPRIVAGNAILSQGRSAFKCNPIAMFMGNTALGYATVWIDGALRAEQRPARVATIKPAA